MARSKLKKFAEIDTYDNVITGTGEDICGLWHEKVFNNQNPITLEMGCGYGDYTIGLARLYPNQNFIGLEVKGNRVWRGATTAREEGLSNVAFLRIRIEFVEDFFTAGEVQSCWIPFSDPFPHKPSRRLISAPFIQRYRKILPADANCHFKTDNAELFDFALEALAEEKCPVHEVVRDLHATDYSNDEAQLTTAYERRYLKENKIIQYVHFSPGIGLTEKCPCPT